ncbi:cytochrome P450 [Microdochium bolleyi]|uniref:Cytochrome P450 n=1 Tax=Microdochium bolleyi TaxID=196109 RepID=A0A136IZX6_9PEZI|nr:cytochrome P450 [Microdochium bolleyi]
MAASSSPIPLSRDLFTAIPGSLPDYTSRLLVSLVLSGGLAWVYSAGRPKSPRLPTINPPKSWLSFFTQDNIKYYLENGKEVQRRGAVEYNDEPYNVITTDGTVTVLPPRFAQEIRNEPSLSFLAVAATNLQSHLQGFDVYAVDTIQGELMLNVARKRLPKILARISRPLAEEASLAVYGSLGSSTEWKTDHPYEHMLNLIARMSSRLFLGPDLCRDETWLNVTKSFAVNSFQASDILRRYPTWLRGFAATWLVPQAKLVRQQATEAEALVAAVLNARKKQQALNRENTTAGQEGDNDEEQEYAIDWFEEEAAGRTYNVGKVQLLLSAVAIQTTTDLLNEVILQLAQRPDYVQELRAEIAGVLRAAGAWTKPALFNMKLLDSAIKEAQRMRPVLFGAMPRIALAPVTIPGTNIVIPKGGRVSVSSLLHHDPAVYANPHEYNIHRFADMRDGDSDAQSHLVSTGPASLGFGHGNHACPGRFFAANELKIALCYLLINYDWEIVKEDGKVDIRAEEIGFTANVNITAQVRYRKRTPDVMEVDLDALS